MPSDPHQRLADERHAQIMTVLLDVQRQARETNGRVTVLEKNVAVLQDRSTGRLEGGIAGALVSAIGTVAGHFWK